MKILNIMKKLFFSLSIYILFISNSFSQELIIGEERIEQGIILIFEVKHTNKIYKYPM